VRKLLVSAVVAALLLAAVGPLAAWAEDAKDVKILAAVSIGGVDRILADVGVLSEMAGKKDAGKMVEVMLKLFTQGKGLVGLDRERPWGVLIGTDGHEVGGCAFVPVTDLKKLMVLAGKLSKDKIKVLDDGVYEIDGRHKKVYVQETHKGWAFIVDDPGIFEYVPADPAAEMAGLDQKYDVAVRLFPGNIPAKHRKKILAEMRKHAERQMARHEARGKHDDEHLQAIRKIIGRKMLQDWQQVARDVEEITFGWKLDEDAANGALEASMIARKGSPTAKFLAGADKVRTAFGGLQLPDAVFSARCSGAHPPLNDKDLDAVIDAMRARAYAKVECKAESSEEKKVGRQIVDGFLDVFKSTAATGKIDAAVSLRLDKDAVTYVAGRYVADGPKLEATINDLVAAVRKKHPKCVGKAVKLGTKKVRDVNFHVASFPIPEKCPRHDDMVEAVGKRFTLVLGIGDEAVYVAAGRDAAKTLKKAIGASKKAGRSPVPPASFTLDLGKLAELATHCPKEKVSATAEKVLEIFKAAKGNDQIRGELLPIKRGLKYRLELDEGLLRLMATAHHHHRHYHQHHKDK